jgi:dTDP-4-amino-4,6-dideoxygalactose transaminase
MRKRSQIKPIFTSLSPNVEKDDIVLVLSLILKPWLWKSFSVFQRSSAIINAEKTPNQTQNHAEELKSKFKDYLGIKYALAFNSGRAAFLAILKCLNFEPDSEILIQGFTCNAVVNPILTTGLKPIFVDIDKNTLNINSIDLERKISQKSRVVLVQHTFGLPANLEKIQIICQQHNLTLIEDCAHSLGAEYQGTTLRQGLRLSSAECPQGKLGTFGKAAFFSFGRDKVISSVFGGVAITNDDQLAQKLKIYQDELPEPSFFWTFQQLLHPILTKFFVMPAYGFFGAGKWLLLFLQKIGLLSKAVLNQEKQGKMPQNFAKKMPEALAILALNQFQKLEKFISHQRQIADFYDKNLIGLELDLPTNTESRIYLRYPVLLKSDNADMTSDKNNDTDIILDKARKEKIFLDDGWRKTVIVPPNTKQDKMNYRAGDCPIAEKVAQEILNLPTHINITNKDAQRIIVFLKEKLKNNGN